MFDGVYTRMGASDNILQGRRCVSAQCAVLHDACCRTAFGPKRVPYGSGKGWCMAVLLPRKNRTSSSYAYNVMLTC